VHGVFAGFNCFTVGKVCRLEVQLWSLYPISRLVFVQINNVHVMLPIELVATHPSRRVDTRSRQFVSLMLNTGQPCLS